MRLSVVGLLLLSCGLASSGNRKRGSEPSPVVMRGKNCGKVVATTSVDLKQR
jgi:hypothetical protein